MPRLCPGLCRDYASRIRNQKSETRNQKPEIRHQRYGTRLERFRREKFIALAKSRDPYVHVLSFIDGYGMIPDEPCAFRTFRHQSNFLSASESSARRIHALDSEAIFSGNSAPETCAMRRVRRQVWENSNYPLMNPWGAGGLYSPPAPDEPES